MAYNEIITGLQVNTGWNLTFNPTGKFPVIAKRAFPTLADAQAYVDDVNGSATAGIVITVTQDPIEKNNGIYLVKTIGDGTTAGELIPAGSGNGSVTADNYTAAKGLATADNVGQLIYVTSDETSETETDEEGNAIIYTKGPYVVSGAGTVSKLGTTSASGDISGDVESLKGDVATLIDEQIKGVTIDGKSDLVSVDSTTKIVNLSLEDTFVKSADIANDLLKLEGVEENAQVNKIEAVTVAGAEVEITNKTVAITFDSVFDASTTSENALQHKAIAKIVADLEGKISEIPKFSIEVVEELPEEGVLAVVYLKKETGEETNNLYEEYIWTGDKFELLGRQKLDLTDYVTSGELTTALADYVTTGSLSTTLEPYALKADYTDSSTLNGLLEEKVDKVDGYGLISDEKLALIDTNAKDVADLKAADSSLDTRLLALEENAVLSVKSENNGILVATVANNELELSLLIGDCSTGKDGVATVADVNAHVTKSIDDAFAWVDAE